MVVAVKNSSIELKNLIFKRAILEDQILKWRVCTKTEVILYSLHFSRLKLELNEVETSKECKFCMASSLEWKAVCTQDSFVSETSNKAFSFSTEAKKKIEKTKNILTM